MAQIITHKHNYSLSNGFRRSTLVLCRSNGVKIFISIRQGRGKNVYLKLEKNDLVTLLSQYAR